MIGALIDPIERIGLFRVPLATAFARARGLPRSAWGTAVAHFAAGMLLFGVIAESQWNAERIVSLKPGESVSVRGYDLTLDGMLPRQGPNYRELIARFTVRRGGDGDRRARAVEAHLPAAQHVDHRGRAADARRLAALSLARRRRDRRRDRGAALSQAAGAADLVRRDRDGARRRAVAVRPPPARRRAEARAQARACSRRSRGVAARSRLLLSRSRFSPRPRSRCSPTKS